MPTEFHLPENLVGLKNGENSFREFRAPKKHGAAVIEPSLAESGDLLDKNVGLLKTGNEFWSSLRESARAELIANAVRYTSAYRDASWAGDSNQPIVMAGHQPAIFHPGVWFKNFALHEIARRQNAIAINLVVDNDVSSGSSLRVPSIDSRTGLASWSSAAFDTAGGGIPYEQRNIRDRVLFDSFPGQIRKTIAPLVTDPCVDQLWKHAQSALDRCGFAGCAFAQARHGLEGEVGLQTLEIPLGVACRSLGFCKFVMCIVSDLFRFQSQYNQAVGFYRKAHGIRSSAHPVPDLAVEGDWIEAPLWIYSDASPKRKSAWVRATDATLTISDREGHSVSLPNQNNDRAAQELLHAMSSSFKLRPRALMTTMYSRLVLSDLFIHGIGGAKYDQLGDLISRSFFGVQAPGYMVISATVHLPGALADSSGEKRRDLLRKVRDTRFQPERFSQSEQSLVERKRQLLSDIPPRGQRSQWHNEVLSLNRQMSSKLDGVRAEIAAELLQLQSRTETQAILTSREHPFCVFPLEYLVKTFQGMLDSR